MSAVIADQTLSHRRTWRPYLAAALLMPVIAIVGFWRTYFGPLLSGGVETTLFIHVHAVLMVAWIAAFIAQVTLAGTGHLRMHVRLGPWVMGLGVLTLVAATALGFQRFGDLVTAGDLALGQRRLIGPVREFIFLGAFLWAAWHWRSKPEIHKRLMIVVGTLMLITAVSRMIFLGRPVPEWKFMLVWPIPVYLAMLHDLIRNRRVSAVYVIGLAAMLTMRLVLPFRDTTAWLEFTRWLAGFYG